MSLQDGFTDKMQAARDAAARARHLGKAGGRPKYAKPAPMEDTAENRLHLELARLQSEIRDRDNTIAVLKAGGDDCATLDDPGAEFDRLFAAAKSEAQACRPGPLSPSRAPVAREDTRGRTMTNDTNTERDAVARKAAQALLSQGLATPSEVARLAGVSRQLVNHWAREIDWRKARSAQLAKAWRKHARQDDR